MSAEQKDLTTTAGGDIPHDNKLTTPKGSNRGFESELSCPECNSLKVHKNKDKGDSRFGDGDYACNNCGNTFNSGNEEGIGSVGGPPADSMMNANSVGKKKEDENLTDANLTDEDLTSEQIGEGVLINKNYIQDQFGVLYRPVYVGESYEIHPHDLIYNNKYYTTEGLGNCVFCQGAGKVTVENIGLKDCPDCDGTGDIQQNPMMPMENPMIGGDPNAPIEGAGAPPTGAPTEQLPNNGAPDQFGNNDPSQPTDPAQIPQQPSQEPNVPETKPKEEEKSQFGEALTDEHKFNIHEANDNLVFDIPKGRAFEFKIGGETQMKIEETKLKAGYVKCEKCEQQFSSVQWALDHMKEAHGATEADSDLVQKHYTIVDDPDFGKSYKCNHCNELFSANMPDGQREEHIMFDHSINESSPRKLQRSRESCACKKKVQAQEASIIKYKDFIKKQLVVLQGKAHAGEAVNVMYGLPTISKSGRKIKGTLAYAGVSLNDRIYLPEELAKGHGLTLPLLLNHSNIAGAEQELDRLDDEMIEHLENEKDYLLGEVTLTWDAEKLTLFYEGVVDHPFFQTEIDDMDMAVSLGIYYDSDSPRVCDENCYTLIKGAEFREVSLVYHAGFPIATIEAVEAELKAHAVKALEDDPDFAKDPDYQGYVGDTQTEPSQYTQSGLDKDDEERGDTDFDALEAQAEEETDKLARGGAVDVEEDDEGTPPTIDLKDDWDGDTIDIDEPVLVESFTTPAGFSVRGIRGMTVSNSNGVQKYTLDPSMGYETNMIHFDVIEKGAEVYGEQLQPKMTTPPDLTKEIEKRPDIKFTSPDDDAFKKKRK